MHLVSDHDGGGRHVRAVHENDLVLDLDLSADWNQVWATLSLDNRLLLSEQGDYVWQQ